MKLLINIDKITTKDTIVTANNRQILAFKQQWIMMHSRGNMPNIINWDTLLIRLWEKQENYQQQQLIDCQQIYYMFYQIIKNSKIKAVKKTIDELINNYSWQQKQQIPIQAIIPQNSMQEYFLIWIKKYKQQKLKFNLIDIFDLANNLIMANPSKQTNYYKYGFRALTKQQQLLFTQLNIQELKIKQKNQDFTNKTFNTIEDEIKSVVKWAYGLKQKNQKSKIAIISPRLAENYYKFEQEFNQIFNQNLSQTKDKSFNISLGKPLSSYNLVKDLLLVLTITWQISENKITTKLLIKLFNSPYFKMKVLDKIPDILKLEQEFINKKQLLKLDNNLKDIVNNLTINLKPNYHHHWLITFEKILKIWGFNQRRKMTSDENQIFNKYLNSSLIFNKLSIFKHTIKFLSAINQFDSILNQVIFQPRAGVEQIQIIGQLEAEGLSFDYAWVIGVNAKFLPFPLKSLRYIPLDICKKYKVPKSEFETIMLDSTNSLQYLSLTAPKVIMSYAKIINDTQIQGSPMINWSNNLEDNQKNPKSSWQILQIIKDQEVKKITNLTIKNGVKTLKNQMQCQFKGFANRLNIDSFNDEYIGINNMQKGIILHKSLEIFYQKVTSKQQLEALNLEELNKLITHAINFAMQDYPKNKFYYIEFEIVFNKIKQFLILEKSRDNWQIISLEKIQKINIAELKFNTRVDRIDRDDNNKIIVFDYKTGKISIKKWCGKAINEPQLPIYTLKLKANAICFIGFKNNIKYQGMAEHEKILPIKKINCCEGLSWDKQNQDWQQTLEQAATDFKNGKAEVNPNQKACRYCNLKDLCRIEN